ncbi:MAG: surface antigen [Marinimicrobia bacterium 46_47]|nr:MAG: surface antigen [Marinimicrobia bacterium 46_47]KUK91749.1 MAG: surface antigen [Marinimicrobia bacterium 46_43]
MDQDLRHIRKFYQKEGFLFAEVQAEKIPRRKAGDINLHFIITENKPVLTDNILYNIQARSEGEKEVIDSLIQERKGSFDLLPGQRFRDESVENMRRELFKILLDHGYPEPDITYTLFLKNEKRQVDVHLTITPGRIYHLGDIRISGNEHIKPFVIQKQVTLEQGDIFSQSALEKNQQLVQQLGLFEYVSIKNLVREKNEDTGTLPVEIFVQELPQWSFKTGAGYGLDERIRFSATIRRQPFFGKARYAVLTLKYSYLEPYHINLKITQPAFLTSRSTLFLNPFARREREKAYNLERFGVSVTFQQGLSSFSNTFVNYTIERNQLDLSEDITDAFLLTNTYYNKSKISWGISTDRSSPLFYPDKGFFASFVTTFSGLPGSQYHYVSALTEFKKFQYITEGLIIAGRIKIGSMKPVMNDESAPIEERFFAGGSNSVRGFLRNELSPKNENDISVGGNSYFEASLEFRHQLLNILSGVLFVDIGNVWIDYNSHNFKDLAWSPGVGIRIRTPIGPIRFDVAYPLNQPDGKVRYHLSFGQAF